MMILTLIWCNVKDVILDSRKKIIMSMIFELTEIMLRVIVQSIGNANYIITNYLMSRSGNKGYHSEHRELFRSHLSATAPASVAPLSGTNVR